MLREADVHFLHSAWVCKRIHGYISGHSNSNRYVDFRATVDVCRLNLV